MEIKRKRCLTNHSMRREITHPWVQLLDEGSIIITTEDIMAGKGNDFNGSPLNEIRTFFSENPNAEFCPVANAKRSASGVPPPPNFVFRFAKCAAKEDVALAPALPCAGNDKELPKILLLEFWKFGIIILKA